MYGRTAKGAVVDAIPSRSREYVVGDKSLPRSSKKDSCIQRAAAPALPRMQLRPITVSVKLMQRLPTRCGIRTVRGGEGAEESRRMNYSRSAIDAHLVKVDTGRCLRGFRYIFCRKCIWGGGGPTSDFPKRCRHQVRYRFIENFSERARARAFFGRKRFAAARANARGNVVTLPS